ncbi:MAG: DUF1963 domain-containing protein [Pseudomonadota bacterium]
MARGRDGGPIGDGDLAALEAEMTALALPAAVITIGDPPVSDPIESALGGPAWRPAGTEWPAWKRRPMLFLAQLNFAEIPPLPDFPESGLLQIFVGDSDVLGCSFPSTPGEGVHIDFWPEPSGGGAVLGPVSRNAPFEDRRIGEHGRRLSFEAAQVLPSVEDWRVLPLIEPLWERPGEETLELFLDRVNDAHPTHHVGGHPEFTQYDIRSDETHADYDRTLLKLGSDEAIMWGDAGEANWLIPATALREHRFDRTLYSWDCT